MICRLSSLTLVAILITSTTTFAQQMREGKWEITSKTEMIGMPMQIPAQTVAICVDAKNQGKPPIMADSSCKFSNQKSSGNTMSWKMECMGDTKLSGEGSLTFTGDAYTGSASMRMDIGGGETMSMKNTYSGRRIGNCG